MNKLKDNPQLNEIETQLRAAAEAADRGEDIPQVNLDSGESVPPDHNEAEGSNKGPQETEDITSVKESPLKGDESDKSGTKAEAKEKEGSEKAEKKEDSKSEKGEEGSKYNQAKENKKLRQNLSEWQSKLKQDEQRIQEERAAIQREREEIARQKKSRSKGSEKSKESELSANDFEDAARDYERQARLLERKGEYDEADKKYHLADVARDRAAKLRKNGVETTEEGSEEEKAGQEQATQVFWENANKHIEANPDLKDATQGMGAEVKAILQGTAHYEVEGIGQEIARLIKHSPRGFELAHQFAKLRDGARKAAAVVPGLQKQITDLKSEIERLTKLTSLSGSGPSSRAGPKTWETMSAEEQMSELEQQAHALEEARA